MIWTRSVWFGLFLAGLLLSICSRCCAQPPSDSLEQIRTLLREGNLDDRRRAAIETLACDPEMQAELLPDFINLLRHETDGQIRLAIFDTLTEMGPAASRAIPALMLAMQRDFGGRYNEEKHQDYRAALALASIGEPAVEGLRNLLLEDAENVRAEAAMALGRIGPAATVAASDLVKLLSDSSSRVRSDVVQALGGIGTGAIDAILSAMPAQDAEASACAISAAALAAPDDERVRSAVMAALDHSSPQVRAAAIKAAGDLPLPGSGELEAALRFDVALRAALSDPDESVRIATVNLLLSRKDWNVDLRDFLQSLLVHEDEGVAWHAAYLLQSQGIAALPSLLEAASHPQSRLPQLARAISMIRWLTLDDLYEVFSEGDDRQRQVAALALGQIRPVEEETVQRLTSGLSEENQPLQSACLSAITGLDAAAAGALDAVRKLRNHPDPSIRRQVIEVWMLAADRNDQLVADLVDKLEDPDVQVQRLVLDSLRSLGHLSRSAIPVVIEKLDHPHEDVRVAAASLLGSHGALAAASVPKLREQLSSGQSGWRITVIETLGALGTASRSALPELNAARRDESPEVRAATIKAIGQLELNLEQLRETLLSGLRDKDAGVRREAAAGLRRLGVEGAVLVADIIPLMTIDHARDDIAELLDRLDRYQTPGSIVDDLVTLLGDDDARVQIEAIKFLGLAGPPAAIALPDLQKLLEHADDSVRKVAETSISQIRGEQTVE